MRNRLLLIILSLSFFISLFGQARSKTTSESLNNILRQYVRDSIPGMAVGIVQNGEIIFESYVGKANLSHDIRISDKTRFNIASNAKQFTALMVLQLSLENKLSLEDDIRKYLPKLYPEVSEEIKIRQLINHSSGIRDYVELMGLKGNIWWKQMGLDNKDVMELLEKQEELGFKPGSKYSYSNTNYIVLAELIEAVTKEKFTNYSKAFFHDMGMHNTYFIERYMGVIPNRAEPYYDWGNNLWLKSPTITKVRGDGFLFTTLSDQLKYEQRLHQTSASDRLLNLSQKPIPNSQIVSYGFGLELSKWSERVAAHHSGATLGYNCQLIRFQEEKLSVLVLSNNGNLRSDLVADTIASLFLPVRK